MQRLVDAQVQDVDLVSERRERILQAAIVVFRRNGFHGATTRAIAQEAGVAQSNIYNYVRSKGDILYLVCDHLVGLYIASVAEVLKTHDGPSERLVNALRAIVEVMFRHREELVLLYNETHVLEKADRKLILKSVSRLTRQFQDLLDAYVATIGPIHINNRQLAANLMTFVPAIVALRWWDLSLHTTHEEAEQSILGFILAGLGISTSAKPT